MGTNYVARVIPKKERKGELKKLIDEDDFSSINRAVEKMYQRFHPYNMDEEPWGEIHLGKRSHGWKFLWDPNMFIIKNGHLEETEVEEGHKSYKFIQDPDTVYYTYPLTKKGIKDFIDREDVKVYDEYGEEQDKDEFFKEALGWTTWKNWKTGEIEEAYDAAKHEADNPNDHHYILNNEYTQMLKNEGFKFTSKTNSDFYSDGLRFASFTDFS
jgi:hypothetical protein